MGAIHFVGPRYIYQARPGRAALVAEDLADLQGPVTGTIVLPLRLFWSPCGKPWCLDERYDLLEMYEIVLQEAVFAAELTGFIHGLTLVECWPDMWVPKGVRRAWEDYHEVLRYARDRRKAGQPAAGLLAPG